MDLERLGAEPACRQAYDPEETRIPRSQQTHPLPEPLPLRRQLEALSEPDELDALAPDIRGQSLEKPRSPDDDVSRPQRGLRRPTEALLAEEPHDHDGVAGRGAAASHHVSLRRAEGRPSVDPGL